MTELKKYKEQTPTSYMVNPTYWMCFETGEMYIKTEGSEALIEPDDELPFTKFDPITCDLDDDVIRVVTINIDDNDNVIFSKEVDMPQNSEDRKTNRGRTKITAELIAKAKTMYEEASIPPKDMPCKLGISKSFFYKLIKM
jgi:hypothetical protein